jgi:hypothetical protein
MKDQGFKPTPQIWSPPFIQPITSFGYTRAKKVEHDLAGRDFQSTDHAPWSMTQDRFAPRLVGVFGSEDRAIRCQDGASIGACKWGKPVYPLTLV